MKNKLLFVVTVVFAFFLGIWGTIIALEYIPKDESVVKTVTEVNISETNTISSSVDKLYDAVVTVQNHTTDLASIGSGFVYKVDDEYGYVLTNNHVIQSAKKLKVLNSKGTLVDATLLGSDEYADLAVLKIEKSAVLKVADLGNSSDLKIGDTVFAVGTPVSLSYTGTVTKGIISAIERTVSVTMSNGGEYMLDVIQTNAAINPGNSGGPLANINGEVIGINTLKLVDDKIEGIGFAIPIELATAVVDRLESGEAIKRPYLGVSTINANSPYHLYRYQIVLNKDYKSGVVLYTVEDNSVSAEAGLKKGDVILKINDYEIVDSAHLRYVLYKYSVGDTVTIAYERNGEAKTVEILLSKSVS